MTFDIGSGARVIATTGEAFEVLRLTPEREDVMLACLDAHPAGATTGQVAAALERSIQDASKLLQELADRGKVKSETRNNRTVWTRWSLDLDEAKVREAHIPKIRAFLTGRRELAGAIARGTGLPLDEVVHTCRWMQLHGQLVGTPVVGLMVYALEARVTTRVDMGRAASIPMSPEARFRAELAKLGPEPVVSLRAWGTPRKPAAPRQPKPPKPAAPVLLPLEEAARKAGLKPRQVRGLVQRHRVTHEGKGVQALVHVEELKAFKPRLRKPKVTREKRQQARAIVKAAHPVPDGYLIATDAARRLGVTPGALHKWLELHDEARALCRKERKYLLVPPQVLTMYTQATLRAGATFAVTVPEGWLPIWEAVATLGWGYSKVYLMLARGRLQAVQVRGRLHFNPEPLKALKAELDAEEQVPEGWVLLPALQAELGLHKSSVSSWMRRNGHEMRTYRDAARQLALYVHPDSAAAYRAFRASTPGGVKVTPEVEARIRTLLPPPPGRTRRPKGATKAVAEQFGMSTSAVTMLLRQPSASPLPEAPLPVQADAEPLPSPDPSPSSAPAPRQVITTEIDRQLRAELTPERRRIPGETARVAAKHGLTISQVRYHLRFTPIPQETAHD